MCVIFIKYRELSEDFPQGVFVIEFRISAKIYQLYFVFFFEVLQLLLEVTHGGVVMPMVFAVLIVLVLMLVFRLSPTGLSTCFASLSVFGTCLLRRRRISARLHFVAEFFQKIFTYQLICFILRLHIGIDSHFLCVFR